MKKTTLSGLLICILVLFAIVGCSGNKDEVAQPTTARVTVMSQGASASMQIGGIDITVVLPAGVTVKAAPDSENPTVQVTSAGVVEASGAAAGTNTSTLATYSAATATMPGTVMVQMVSANGFGTGEFVTIDCDIATGSFPTVTDFSVTLVKAVDINGAAIALTVGYTADIQ